MAAKFKNKYRIESNRWQFWDYSAPASYFITICIAERKCILGDVKNGKIILSEYGEIVETEIQKIPQYHKRAILDVSVVMPNHIHCIITLGDYDFDNGISSIGDGNVDVPIKKIHEFSQPSQQKIQEFLNHPNRKFKNFLNHPNRKFKNFLNNTI